VAEVGGQRIGMLLGFPMPARDPSDAVSPPPFDPHPLIRASGDALLMVGHTA
jgi:hypothetical protein